VILNVEEKERVIKLCQLRFGALVHFGSGNALVEQGFEPVKGIATAINCRRNCLVFSRRSEALVQSVKSGEVAKTMPWRRPARMA
jgi:hypothetical protein